MSGDLSGCLGTCRDVGVSRELSPDVGVRAPRYRRARCQLVSDSLTHTTPEATTHLRIRTDSEEDKH